jgi:hypothetical protein
MAVSRPILALAPPSSHVGEIMYSQSIGWRVSHGDAIGMRTALRTIVETGESEIRAMGERAATVLRAQYTPQSLLDRFCALLD